MSDKTKTLIIGIIIVSIIAAVCIHLAFIPKSDNPWIYAKWTGGEILTYIGTIALGVIAIGQNGKIEDISTEANKMNVLSKAIEYEMSKKEKRERLLECLNNELNVDKMLTYILEETNQDRKAMAIFNIKVNVKSSIDAVLCDIEDDKSCESQELQKSIQNCAEQLDILLNNLYKYNIESCEAELMALKECAAQFGQKKNTYCKAKQSKLDGFIYNDIINMKKIY